MATLTDTAATEVAAPPSVPPLENGDRLTRPEFERRYDAMPGLKKAELIEGVVYLPSQGLASPEHAEFVTRLQQKAAGGA